MSEEDILCNCQSRQSSKLLHDDGNAFFICLNLILWMNFFAIQNKSSTSDAVNTSQHIGQSGFTGSILTDQSVNLSFVYVEGYVLHGFGNTKVLAKIFNL